ncbi:zinc finger domain-containing protein [Streptomyces noursei]|uniref:zinc finger domain-containing protein n=1 Tax=Streptomyces noursei TaxID=1971 RepID=UPI003BF552C9
MHCAKIRAHGGPSPPSPTEGSDAYDVEQHACPKCDAQPGAPCRSRRGRLRLPHPPLHHAARLKKALRVPRPTADRADRGGRAPRRRRRGDLQDGSPHGFVAPWVGERWWVVGSACDLPWTQSSIWRRSWVCRLSSKRSSKRHSQVHT